MLFALPHFRKLRSFVAGFALLAPALHAAPLELSVANGGSIQAALDQCPPSDGCVVRLKAGTYDLPNSLLLRNKENVRITGSGESSRPVLRFQDDGSLAGPDNNADTLVLKPKGWKRWPLDGLNQVGGSADRTNPYSMSGIQHNGAFLILNCRKIIIDSIVIDGKTPIGWGSLNVWQGVYPTFYGNFGLNLSYSQDVLVRNSEFRNCFAGVYVKGVAYSDSLHPMKSLREKMGGHIFEKNDFHHNTWAAYREANFGKGLVWRENRIWENHNSVAEFTKWYTMDAGKKGVPTFNRTNATGMPGVGLNSEALVHAGGFLFFKDSSKVDSIYRNTFWNNYRIVGFDFWRMSSFVFTNNIVADPWLAYNADTTGFVTDLFSRSYGQYPEVILSATAGTRAPNVYQSNTFASFPKIPLRSPVSLNGCMRGKDACALLRDSLQNEFLPKNRFYIYKDSVRRDTVSRTSPKIKHEYISFFLYQGFNTFPMMATGSFWGFEKMPSPISSRKRNILLLGEDNQVHSYEYYPVDSAQIENQLHYFSGKPAPDTLGRILQITSNKTKGDSAFDNFYIKSIPLNLDAKSPYFLMPLWTDFGVDSVILGKAWAPAGEEAPLARGALQPTVVVPILEEPEPGPVGIQADRLASKAIRMTTEGFLVFANPTVQGTCYVYALDGRVLGAYRLQNGRSLLPIVERGAIVLRWQQQGILRQQKMMRW